MRRWWLAAAAMFGCGWGGNQFTPLLLMYRHTGGYSEVTVDAFLAAYVVGLVPGLLVAGPLSDRHGRKPWMLAGTALSALASAVLAVGVAGEAFIYAGRLLAGVGVGIAMAVGTSWMKELSQGPFDPEADAGTGARRASLSLTAGFGLGAGVAGVLAQWGPWPMVTPYAAHIAVALPALAGLARVPETRPRACRAEGRAEGRIGARAGGRRSLRSDLRVPSAGHRRFLWVVVPMAPWVFGAAGIAYAVTPQLVADRVGHWGLAYATLLTVLTLGAGVLVQPLAKRLGGRSTAWPVLTAMALMTAGMAVSASNAAVRSPWLGAAGGVLLGAAYGIALVSGLLEVQRIATAEDLAGLTGVYYAITYTGFLVPAALAALSAVTPYTVMLAVVALLASGCLAVIAVGLRRHGSAAEPVCDPV
ncbi:MFS transporter [Microtetraspora niveoalba]|uniref:MFS transporter n=1 Tax=Microtetraspora niveoalba TaxID=46175 RepID=UPI0008328DBF|nr:MFS transporter [Microtetraspora niveoalba]